MLLVDVAFEVAAPMIHGSKYHLILAESRQKQEHFLRLCFIMKQRAGSIRTRTPSLVPMFIAPESEREKRARKKGRTRSSRFFLR